MWMLTPEEICETLSASEVRLLSRLPADDAKALDRLLEDIEQAPELPEYDEAFERERR